ncbi:MAG TPA: aminopeptidase P family protein [Candidatus Nanopelagicaceae bacterium]|nr:aminopeptidase P family protein [Candidatus Nanopelagicaceae bacterium]
MTESWEARPRTAVTPIPGAAVYRARREDVSRRFSGLLVVIPSGSVRTRSADAKFRFRPSTEFIYLVGEGEPDEVLVMQPRSDGGHRIRLYVEPETDFSRPDFFTDRTKGELWVGPRRGLAATYTRFGLEASPLPDLGAVIDTHPAGVVLRGLDSRVDEFARHLTGPDQDLQIHLSEMRLVKDDLDVELLQDAIDLTEQAFEDVVRALPQCQTERDVEVAFFQRARSQGNDTGYSTIAAAGAHATTLHWRHNSGRLRPGELLLLDAGVETDRYYTADITRTLPINGRFTPAQRAIYTLVWQAQQAGIAAVKPGADFLAPNRAAQEVLAKGLERLGVLPVTAQESLRPESQLHQRYTLHGVSHMLGLDVHDCAHARQEHYTDGRLTQGMVLTVEPGLYFQPNDATVPSELRGIGVRIEDDVLVTSGGCKVLSAAIPTHPDAIEAWMRPTGAPQHG